MKNEKKINMSMVTLMTYLKAHSNKAKSSSSGLWTSNLVFRYQRLCSCSCLQGLAASVVPLYPKNSLVSGFVQNRGLIPQDGMLVRPCWFVHACSAIADLLSSPLLHASRCSCIHVSSLHTVSPIYVLPHEQGIS